MKRSSLENKYYKCNSETNRRALKKQKNYCNRLYKRERMNYYSNLNSNEITDNKNLWKTMNPFFTTNCRGQDNIILVNKEENKIRSDDTEVAQTFNDFFKYAVKALDIGENRLLITETGNLTGVEKAIKIFEIHPSIVSISEHCVIDTRFFFSDVSIDDIVFEIKCLNSKKSETFMNIPVKLLTR